MLLTKCDWPWHMYALYSESIGMQVREDNIQKETELKVQKSLKSFDLKEMINFSIMFWWAICCLYTFLFCNFHLSLILIFLFFSYALGHFQGIQTLDNKIIPITCVSTDIETIQTSREKSKEVFCLFNGDWG